MPDSRDSTKLPDSLKKGYLRFRELVFSKNDVFYKELAEKGQSPKALWIGCVDSRVSPCSILGLNPGELLVLTNVGNIVPPFEADESSVGSFVNQGVSDLGISHLIVCGHSDCAGTKALAKLNKGPMDKMLSSWVEYGISALEETDSDDLESLGKANVLVQSRRLLGYPDVAEAMEKRQLVIHPLYFDIGTGVLERYDYESSQWEAFA